MVMNRMVVAKHLRVRQQGEASSRADGFDHSRFRSATEVNYFKTFSRVRINNSRFVDPETCYGTDIVALFEGTGAEPLIPLLSSFHSEFIQLWFCNLTPMTSAVTCSYIVGEEVIIEAACLATTFVIPADDAHLMMLIERGDDVDSGWNDINMELSGIPRKTAYDQEVGPLTRDAYMVQFVLHDSLFLKVDDKKHVNATLALAMYHYLHHKRFNMDDVIM